MLLYNGKHHIANPISKEGSNLMNETYLVVNGNRINLPKQVIDNIVKNLKPTIIEQEFIDILSDIIESNSLINYVSSNIKVENNILYVLLPPGNSKWSFAIWKATEIFCDNNSKRYPDFTNGISKAGYVSINF
jgi:hypothetical protein